MNTPRILVAGVGNIFLGDDAFGVEVVRRLSARDFADSVRIVDFGIRGLDLAYALLDGYDAVILVDAVPRGGAPGQIYMIEVDDGGDSAPDAGPCCIEAHDLNPAKVLRLVRAMEGHIGRLIVIGCEPEPMDAYEDLQPGLSDAVLAAIPRAVETIVRLIGELIEAGTDKVSTAPVPKCETIAKGALS